MMRRQFTGGVTLISNFAQVTEAVGAAMQGRVVQACHEVRNEWMRTLSGARSGKRYRVPGAKRWYTASAPGQAPAQATGRLRQSIRVMPRFGWRGAQARVGTPLEYAVYLEYGTRYMDPRPHLRVSYERARPAIRRILGERM